MNTLYTIFLLIIGVIGTNIIKQFIPKIPDAFILIIVGVCLSFTNIFHDFELEPEFFMLVVIAPLMFLDGQQQSFSKIRQRFSIIFILSVVLAIVSAAAVGLLANWFESKWTLPLAIALAAIVVPTDAVAVKSLTATTKMPEGVNEALELESLFNDATGLVMLDLALSVLQSGSISFFSGLSKFLFVSIGGVIVGILTGFFIVWLRTNISFRTTKPETTIIPISLLTPFVVYMLAEYCHTSGILAVVATGIVHNWESSKLKLTSTNVQLTQNTVWETIANVLNSVVFIILGISLPTVWHVMSSYGTMMTLQLIGLAILIYITTSLVRFVWARQEDNPTFETLFEEHNAPQHSFNARIFAISGVHGTVTLAMAFSLPKTIAGHTFPYREELIIVATTVIIISMIISAIALPVLLPKKIASYTLAQLNETRDAMVDYATIQMRRIIPQHDEREQLTSQLQSQKGFYQSSDRQALEDSYQTVRNETQQFILDYLHSQTITEQYDDNVIAAYEKIINRFTSKQIQLLNTKNRILKQIYRRIKYTVNHFKWHIVNGQYTKKQKLSSRQKWLQDHQDKKQDWLDIRNRLLDLNTQVINQVDKYLDSLLDSRIKKHLTSNQDINMVRKEFDHYFSLIRRDYSTSTVKVDNTLFIRAFQEEYNYVQQQLDQNMIPNAMATVLYTEINQAQSLQLQQNETLDSLVTDKKTHVN
ncbi:cation:proton antiporter [Leuconostoc palmae]|uniref:cation:proton antiporter n=1 Tax=Leuconostoc palmae TaxID=501487 RepID=UPI001C7D7176|nr:sodium:proton antiporter [Leuconostoc palmae]